MMYILAFILGAMVGRAVGIFSVAASKISAREASWLEIERLRRENQMLLRQINESLDRQQDETRIKT